MNKDNLKRRIIRVAITSVIVFAIANVVASFGVSGNIYKDVNDKYIQTKENGVAVTSLQPVTAIVNAQPTDKNRAAVSTKAVSDKKVTATASAKATPSANPGFTKEKGVISKETATAKATTKAKSKTDATATATVKAAAKVKATATATTKAAATAVATAKSTAKSTAKAKATATAAPKATATATAKSKTNVTATAKAAAGATAKAATGKDTKAKAGADAEKKDDVSDVTVAKSDKVEDEYFQDALFIGDSRMEGFKLSSGLTTGTYATKTGASISNLRKDEIIRYHGKSYTIYDFLKEKKFGKIYIKTGINELGWAYPSVFIKEYKEFIENIKELQPDAVIYVESIIHVTKSLNDSSDIFKNSKINAQNERIMKMVKEVGVNYIDLNEIFTDSNGALAADAANDGVHMKSSYLKKWLDYLKCHVVA